MVKVVPMSENFRAERGSKESAHKLGRDSEGSILNFSNSEPTVKFQGCSGPSEIKEGAFGMCSHDKFVLSVAH